MPTYEVTSPDGKKYRVEAPEGATQSDAIDYIRRQRSGSTAAPTPSPSPSLGGRSILSPEEQSQRLQDLGGVLKQTGLGVGKGAADTIGLGYNAAQWLGHKTGLYDIRDLEQQPLYQQFGMNLPEPTSDTQRYARRMGEFLGSSLPFTGTLGLASRALPMVPLLRSFARASVPKLASAEVLGAMGGGGLSQLAENEEYGPLGQAAAGIVGGFAAPAAGFAAARKFVQMGDSGAVNLFRPTLGTNAVPPRPGAGAAPTVPPARQYLPEDLALAEQHWANSFGRQGLTQQQVRDYEQMGNAAHVFHSTGEAPRADMLMDITPQTAEEVGAQMRLHSGAGRMGQARLTARQTGETPLVGLDQGSGLQTYEKGHPNLLAFRTGSPGEPIAASQGQRSREALQRATLTQDPNFHGFGETAEQTAADIAARRTAQSDKGFEELRQLGANVNLQKERAVQRVVNDLVQRSENKMIGKTRQAALKEVLSEIAPEGKIASNIDDVDRARQVVQEKIQELRATTGNTARIRMKEMGDAVTKIIDEIDNVQTNGLGAKYGEVRGLHADESELLKQLELGEKLRKGEATIHDYNSYSHDRAAQKIIRHGFVGQVLKEQSALPAGSDMSRLFNTPDKQRMIGEILDNTPGALKQGGTTRERFFDYLRMLEREKPSQNIAFGGSQTAAHIQSDKLADTLHKLSEIFKGGPATTASRGAQYIYQSAFGKDANVAAAMVDMMTTVDPVRRQQHFNNIIMRMGRNPFLKALDKLEAGIARHGAKAQSALPGSFGIAAEDK